MSNLLYDGSVEVRKLHSATAPTAGQLLVVDADGKRINGTAAATGDVTGPGASTAGNLPSFSGTSGKVLQDSGLASSLVSGAAQKSANLSDLANAGTARGNLGLGNSATRNVGTGAGTVAAGDDSRLPSSDEKSALAGTTGTPGSTNRFVTMTDGRLGFLRVKYATAAALPACAYTGTPTFTLTATANGALSIDGSTPSVGDLVLVFQQVTATNNGWYVVTQVGDASHPWILTRYTMASDSSLITTGMVTYVWSGSTLAGRWYWLSTTGTITLDSSNLTFGEARTLAAALYGSDGARYALGDLSVTDGHVVNSSGTYVSRADHLRLTPQSGGIATPLGASPFGLFARTYGSTKGATYSRNADGAELWLAPKGLNQHSILNDGSGAPGTSGFFAQGAGSTGTASSGVDADGGEWRQYQQTANAANAEIHCGGVAILPVRPWILIPFSLSLPNTSVRWFVGLAGATSGIVPADTPTTWTIGITLSTARGDTYVQFSWADGTNPPTLFAATVTGLKGTNLVANQVYYLLLDYQSSTSVTLSVLDPSRAALESHEFTSGFTSSGTVFINVAARNLVAQTQNLRVYNAMMQSRTKGI